MRLLHEGQIVRAASSYEIERFLGEGAFAEVYRIKHRFFGRQALKIFKMSGMTVEEIEKMLGEAMLLSQLGHPNIIRVYDANVTETSRGICGFFTMEYVAGGTLEQFWRSHGSRFVPVATAVEIIQQVCRGLAVGHAASPPIIHRDITPQNILVGYDYSGLRARVTDFGLAKQVNPLTLLASARGTRCFKPPEAFQEVQSDSCVGDVWAIGSTLYLLLTDRLPYFDMDEGEIFDSRCFERPMIPPSRLNVQVDPALDRIIHRALSYNPKDRYSNAMAFLEDLTRWKPQAGRGYIQKDISSTQIKTVLGAISPADESSARQMVQQALAAARAGGQLAEAADLMEEAFNKWPELRRQYENKVRLWRRGIIM